MEIKVRFYVEITDGHTFGLGLEPHPQGYRRIHKFNGVWLRSSQDFLTLCPFEVALKLEIALSRQIDDAN